MHSQAQETRADSWKKGFAATASFTFDVDGEAGVLHEMTVRNCTLGLLSHQQYGPKVGVPRILDILARHGIKATFFLPAYIAATYPTITQRIHEEGHSLGVHGYYHERLSSLSSSQRREILHRSVQMVGDVVGELPRGYRAPMWDLTWDMPQLLIDEGLHYDSSLMNADSPYWLSASDQIEDGQRLLEMPINWIMDDWEQYVYLPDYSGSGYIGTTDHVYRLWMDELEGMRQYGGAWILTNHPFASGRPGRARALESLFERVKQFDDVWLTDLEGLYRQCERANDVDEQIIPTSPERDSILPDESSLYPKEEQSCM